ncbi:MAG: pullulanase-type alpha-1,6-glucosidase [Actinomycetota bacterium]|nr:pullulanase-type alpha-1,6-glucosidase [Actinomycetota bacterium]
MKRKSWVAVAASVVTVLSLIAVPLTAGADPATIPDAVSVPGTFGAQVGCPGDWQPDCAQIQLTRRTNDDVWSTTLTLRAGSYEYKAALNKTWDVAYGKGGSATGANIGLAVPADGTQVTFYYDNSTHWVTTNLDGPIVTAAGSFQSELGCPADWSPDCLRSWLEDPDGDGVYTFTTRAIPAGDYHVKAAVGLSWAESYGQGGSPTGANIDFTVPSDGSPVTFNYVASTHGLTVLSGNGLPSLRPLQAYWLSRNYIGWNAASTAAVSYRLYAAPNGGLTPVSDGITGGTSYPLTVDPAGLPTAVRSKFPAQAGLTALKLSDATAGQAASILTGQVAVAAFDADGKLVDATGLQIPGVLDDIDAGAAHATLGLTWTHHRPKLALWAPTAQAVAVNVYASGHVTDPLRTVALTRRANGVWTVTGRPSWKGRYYLFTVQVYVPETGKVEHNLVTDPYSYGLSTNSERSLFIDLSDPRIAPAGWPNLAKPKLRKPVDQSITEVHIRDFSVADPTVPAAHRGTYLAFTDKASNAVKHLQALARAGTTAIHLLPAADIASRSINETKSTWQSPNCDLPSIPPDSDQQQSCVTAVAARDGYNWGYDPLHYTTPEGSYATNAEGAARTLQFRKMVSALNHDGLRFVLDVVYNHTADSGQSGTNDLDRIVPGYYHRLDATGQVTTSSCCADTASEHMMMAKLLIDSVTTWATQYKVDGFRFDLMSFTPKPVIERLRAKLNGLTHRHGGVNGRQIYLYGEGWNFGTVADNALFVQASQANLAGTGVGTFNDRIRDAVRGGAFNDTDPRTQGYASGLFTDPNGDVVNGDRATQKAKLLLYEDQIKVGLAGNLKNYRFIDRTGAMVTGREVDYNGQPTGYTAQPQEAINYVDAHDNQTLYDMLTYKLPVSTTMADRVRMQTLALSTTAFSQGVSFWLGGTEGLRSKSFDANSYDSGDWFNAWDPSLHRNGFAKGLPPAASNQAQWPYMKPLLANPTLNPTHPDLLRAEAQSEMLLKVRATSPLLHLGSAKLIQQKLSFPGSGPNSTPGVIVERIDDTVGPNVDPALRGMVIVFNASPQATAQTIAAARGQRYRLNPVQASSTDPVVKTSTFNRSAGTFTTPGRTVAVFVQR